MRSLLGFTLVEVLVVIVILGILAALVVPRVLERPDEARVIAAKNDSSQRIVEETADLLYHLIVTLVEKGVTLEEITEELQKRQKSGKRN